MQEPTLFQQIGRLFLVIFSGIAAAVALSVFFLYFYGPSGTYKLDNVLLSPEVSEGLRYQEKGQGYRFSHFEFLYYQEETNNWKSVAVNEERYRRFYDMVKGDKGESLAGDRLKEPFYETNPAILSLVVKKEGAQDEQVFQELQIAVKGDVYRVQLREEQTSPQWAYFLHPGIYAKTLSLMEGR
jgi:hypothetical protein